jgi:hypothetical protein
MDWVGFMVSHPCARKKAQRWGTETCGEAEEKTVEVRGRTSEEQKANANARTAADPSTALRMTSLSGGEVRDGTTWRRA